MLVFFRIADELFSFNHAIAKGFSFSDTKREIVNMLAHSSQSSNLNLPNGNLPECKLSTWALLELAMMLADAIAEYRTRKHIGYYA